MNFSDFSVYFTELLICTAIVVAVRTLGGAWLGPGTKRLLWTLLILKALVPFTLPTAYHPMRLFDTPSKIESVGDLSPKGRIDEVDFGTVEKAELSKFVQPPSAPQPFGERPAAMKSSTVLPAVWLLGFITLLGCAVWRNRSVVARATKKPVAVPDWVQTIFLDYRETLRLGTWPVLIVSPYVPTPCLVGAVRPRILIPESLVEQHDDENEQRIRFLLLHELVHLKQGDVWLAWLWTLTLAVHWFNPLFWILGRLFKFDCETACDDRVLAILEQKERREYGDSLIRMMLELNPCAAGPGTARVRFIPGSCAVIETRSNLERRLTMMKSYRKPTLQRSVAATVVFLGIAAFCLTSYAEPKLPISAEKAKMMGYVEDFFMNNYRDVTMRKSLAWGDPTTDDKGNVSITYKYDALIWNKDRIVIEDKFTFDKDGKYVESKKISSETVSKKEKVDQKNITQQTLKSWVERFFSENFHDVTSRKTLKWGEMKTNDDGTYSIDYRYEATIRNKDKKVIEQRFTFDKSGKYVGHETLESLPFARNEKSVPGKPDAAASRKKAQEGWKRFMSGNSPEGEPLFQEATELDPKNANAWQGLGWSQWAQGKGDDAKKSFEICLTLDKRNTAALNGLGQIAQAAGDTDKAIEIWTEGTKLDPRATGPMAALAAVYDGKDDYPNAIKYYEMWLRAEPNNDDAKAALKKVKEKVAKK